MFLEKNHRLQIQFEKTCTVTSNTPESIKFASVIFPQSHTTDILGKLAIPNQLCQLFTPLLTNHKRRKYKSTNKYIENTVHF